MQHPDEGMIHAWIDGALMAEEAASLESHSAQCDQCAAAIAEARGLMAASSRILLSLDDVPAGVIPLRAPKQRAWYARNDLRAAAAVLFVASASLVVVRGGQDASPRMNDIASVAIDSAASASASAAASTASAESRAMALGPSQASQKSKADAGDADRVGGRNSQPEIEMARQHPGVEVYRGGARSTAADNFAAPTATQAMPSASVSPTVASPVARAGGLAVAGADLSAKVVAERTAAGDATADSRTAATGAGIIAAPLKIIRADTLKRVRTIVYEVSKGVEVTLTHTEPTNFDQPATLQGRVAGGTVQAPSAPLAAPTASATVPPGAGSVRSVMKAAPINSISWADSATGKAYTLKGALSPGELEALKARIVEQRKHGFPPSRK